MGDDFFRDWDAGSVEPQQPMELLPNGEYPAIIEEAEWKPTKDGRGERLNLTFSLIEGQYKNRKVWEGLNLKNPSTQAVEISKSQMSAICRAIGRMKLRGLPDLYNLPLVIVVKQEKRDDNGEMKNVIKGYKPRATAAAAPQSQPRPTQDVQPPQVAKPQPVAAVSGEPAPWQ